jgi:hypothetical protein
LVRGDCLDGRRERHALGASIGPAQQLVGAVLDPRRHVRIGGAAVGRVVLEAAVLGGIVGRRDYDAICEARPPAAVVYENPPRDDRRRRHAIVPLYDGLHPVGRQHLERRALGGPGDAVRVLAHVERAVDALAPAVVADGLGDGQDVGFGERAAQRRAPMPAGAEAHELVGIANVRLAFVILPLEPGEVDQHLLWSRPASQGRYGPGFLYLVDHRHLRYSSGHAFACQISAAYSAIVRSLENFPSWPCSGWPCAPTPRDLRRARPASGPPQDTRRDPLGACNDRPASEVCLAGEPKCRSRTPARPWYGPDTGDHAIGPRRDLGGHFPSRIPVAE